MLLAEVSSGHRTTGADHGQADQLRRRFRHQGETDDELVANAYAHMKDKHPDLYSTLSREEILGMAAAV